MQPQTFEAYRPYLFTIAYQLLGSVMDAEDVLQEAYLRCLAVDEAGLESPKAYLATVVTRLGLNQLGRAAEKRETYIGPWLPEPLLAAGPLALGDSLGDRLSDRLEKSEAVSMAFLLLLEQLTPAERAVFLLREVFEYDYPEIARMLDKSEPACRQLFSRARRHITAHRPRFASSPQEHQRLLESFFKAVQGGQVAELADLLAEDVTAWTDGGGKVFAALHPLTGRDLVARFVLNSRRFAAQDFRLEVAQVNGKPAGLLRDPYGRVFLVIALDVAKGRVQTLYLVANPEKLSHLPPAA